MSVRVLHQAEPVARKQHKCDMCGRTIEPGEKYLRQRNALDGDLYVWRECQHCLAMLRLYPVITQWADEDYGSSPEDISDCWEPDTDLAREHKRQWTKRWRNGGELYPVPQQLEVSA